MFEDTFSLDTAQLHIEHLIIYFTGFTVYEVGLEFEVRSLVFDLFIVK